MKKLDSNPFVVTFELKFLAGRPLGATTKIEGINLTCNGPVGYAAGKNVFPVTLGPVDKKYRQYYCQTERH